MNRIKKFDSTSCSGIKSEHTSINRNKIENSHKKLVVWINTYNRVKSLEVVFNEVIKYKKDYNIKLLIFDDGSSDNYQEIIDKFSKHLDIEYEKIEHCGKKKYWKLCNYAMSKIRNEIADYYYWIPDDIKMCDNFFDVSIDMLESINDKNKICLNLLMDREGLKNWTNKLPQQVKHGEYNFWKTHWIDCCAIMKENFFKAIQYKIQPIPENRWNKDPNRSSGVGEYISKLLDPNFLFFQPQKSLLIHGDHSSKMNPGERKVNELKTKSVYNSDSKPTDNFVTFSMATMPSRIELLKKVINSIYNQTDKINIYLNNFDSVPKFLNDDKININMSQDYGDLGDAGKFFCCESVEGYHFTIDDDIVYPENYTQTLIDGIEKYNRKYLVGIHASVFNKNFIEYTKSRTQYHCAGKLAYDVPVHMLGTGTLGYHTDTIDLKRKIFEYPNMADTWLSKYCQANKIGCIALKRDKGWIEVLNIPLSDTIFGKGVSGKSKSWDVQNRVLKNISFKIYGEVK